MSETENVKTVTRNIEDCNSGVLADTVPTLADDVVHNFLSERFPPIRGAEHLARFWRKSKQVSDSVWSIDQILAQGDPVVSECSLIWLPWRRAVGSCCGGRSVDNARAGVTAEVRGYFVYDEQTDGELTSFRKPSRGNAGR